MRRQNLNLNLSLLTLLTTLLQKTLDLGFTIGELVVGRSFPLAALVLEPGSGSGDTEIIVRGRASDSDVSDSGDPR
jgi:hypothetical protein